MVDPDIREKYQVTIGLETHVQLKTKTKLFSSVANDAREAPPNTLTSHIDFGLPGALPVLNQAAVELAARAAFALGTEPQKLSKFDRKHYFYPDLPKGYQITQLSEPIIVGGEVEINLDGKSRKIKLHHAHMEEDAGKSTHPVGKDYSLVDLNRAGTPLIEIVSEPDMHSAAEAKAYARELWLLMKYADVSDASLYYGNMRFDVNVSVSKTSQLGTRTETKNLNSFRSVEKAAEYEINRQIELLENGEKIVQETRGWLDDLQKTVSQRGKEDAHDYRYMPEPDLPPIVLTDEFIASIEARMPVLPSAWRGRLVGLGLDDSQTETLLEAELDDEKISYLSLVEQVLADENFAKQLANWFVNLEIPLRRVGEPVKLDDADARLALYRNVSELIGTGKLSSTNAKELITSALVRDKMPSDLEKYASDQGLIQQSDEGKIAKIVEQVLAENAQAASDVKNGEEKAVGFLVGQVMKASRGQANPALAQELIKKHLEP